MEVNVLNLDRSTDRLSHFRRVNRHLGDVKRVSAVDGRSLDREDLVRSGVIERDLPYTMGAIGCALSHGRLWKQAVAEGRPLTVAEDDAIFSYFFEEKSRALLRTIDPDWDFILWGYGLRQFLWVDVIQGSGISEIRFADKEENLKLEDFQMGSNPCALLRMVNSFTYVCYSVSPKGARKLLERCFPLRQERITLRFGDMVQDNEGIDCVANAVYPDAKCYVCVAPLAVSDFKLPSTIR